MTTYTHPSSPILGDATHLNSAIDRFSAEVKAFALAIAQPNRLIDSVEQMIALQQQARQVQDSDPARASALRVKASRISL